MLNCECQQLLQFDFPPNSNHIREQWKWLSEINSLKLDFLRTVMAGSFRLIRMALGFIRIRVDRFVVGAIDNDQSQEIGSDNFQDHNSTFGHVEDTYRIKKMDGKKKKQIFELDFSNLQKICT